MKLAVTDACIFIDLIELQLISEFFGLPIEIHATLDGYNELFENQKEILKAYRSVGKLSLHNIQTEERIKILEESFPKSLSESDKAVRNYAKSKSIDYHGMLWIFDKLIEAKMVIYSGAIIKIDKLISRNLIYQNNSELMSEIEKKKMNWAET